MLSILSMSKLLIIDNLFKSSFSNDIVSVRTGRKMNKRESINEIDRINRYVVIEGKLFDRFFQEISLGSLIF
jgi:hypothetical protein